ncbi:UNVERIFIED_CONTAM: hypothetical protein HHA_452990 [Hammondia hammondi]|eukprot:XP_008886224.1 hypothetical protein HHA_452990 [Hammondia hammondi]
MPLNLLRTCAVHRLKCLTGFFTCVVGSPAAALFLQEEVRFGLYTCDAAEAPQVVRAHLSMHWKLIELGLTSCTPLEQTGVRKGGTVK